MLAEERIKKLARQPPNTICPNCGLEKKFGFSSVCMMSLAFVCNECKSSHQAISHRCKSLTMSSWTDAEVLQIVKAGANDGCRQTWLAKAPPIGQGGRPKPGDDIAVYKRFVEVAYERRLYYSDEGRSGPTVEANDDAPVAAPASNPSWDSQRAPVAHAWVPSATPSVATADLLDFGAFDAHAPTAPVSQDLWSTPAAASTSASRDEHTGHASFGDFASAPAPAWNAASQNSHTDLFTDFASAGTPATGSSQNDPFASFASAPSASAVSTGPKKPIMQGSSGNASAISAMGMPMQQQPVNSMMGQFSPPLYMTPQQQQMMSMMNYNMMQQQAMSTGMMGTPMNGITSMGGMAGRNGMVPQQQHIPMTNHMGQSLSQQQGSYGTHSQRSQQQSSKPDPFADLL